MKENDNDLKNDVYRWLLKLIAVQLAYKVKNKQLVAILMKTGLNNVLVPRCSMLVVQQYCLSMLQLTTDSGLTILFYNVQTTIG